MPSSGRREHVVRVRRLPLARVDNLQILRDLLTSAGFAIIEAKDGEAGVRAAASERPGLILMDIQLPLLDGYEPTRRIKAAPALRRHKIKQLRNCSRSRVPWFSTGWSCPALAATLGLAR
jgi:DNA-binding NarL/FixJ family response regulator